MNKGDHLNRFAVEWFEDQPVRKAPYTHPSELPSLERMSCRVRLDPSDGVFDSLLKAAGSIAIAIKIPRERCSQLSARKSVEPHLQ